MTLAVALLSIFQPLAVQKSELALYDLMLAERIQPPQSTVPVVVGIDEESLAAFGQWPWPRYRLALLIEQLQRLGAEVVALDFLMPESDRTAPDVIQSERLRDRMDAATTAVAPPTQDRNSKRLAVALGNGTTVLGYYLDFAQPTAQNRSAQPPHTPVGMVVSRSPHGTGQWPQPQGQIRSLSVLTDAASAEGFTNALQDVDGTLRRVPLLLSSANSQNLPSLALTALLMSSPQRTLRLNTDPNDVGLDWGQRHIPLDRAGNLMLDWRSNPPTYLSAQSVLKGTVAPDSLRGKVVFVGAWSRGLGDLHLTPTGQSVFGVAVHATVVDNILSGTFITRPAWARGAELVAVLVAGVWCTLLLGRPGFVWAILVVVLGTAGFYGGARHLLVAQGVYLSPLLPMLVLVVITSFLSLMKYGIEARKLNQRTHELLDAQDGIIVSLSVLSEARDKETGGHILRTQRYVELLAEQLATMKAYDYLSASDIKLLAKSAPLHDIGKVGIPDSILQKPGKLTPEEYAIMQNHPLIGAQAIEKIMAGSSRPGQNSFLDYARQMIESHHERWDGKGYPHRLSGHAIPLAGRLMALADVYDALISKRVYKRGFSHDEVRQMLIKESGAHFDPDVVAAFLAREADFLRVSEALADPHQSPEAPPVVPAPVLA